MFALLTAMASLASPCDAAFESLRSEGSVEALYVAHVAYARADLGDHVPRWVLIDTGANRTAIDRGVATTLGLQASGTVQVEGTGGVISAAETRLERVTIGDLVVSLTPTVSDLSGLTGPSGESVDGILGGDAFGQSVVVLDFERSRIAITPSGTSAALAARCGRGLDLTDDNGIPALEAHVGGALLSLRYDSGAGLFRDPRLWINLTEDQHKVTVSGQTSADPVQTLGGSGTGGQLRLPVFDGGPVRMGDLSWPVSRLIVQPRQGYFARPDAIGFVGNAAFHPFGLVVIDYSRMRLVVPPAPAEGAETDERRPRGGQSVRRRVSACERRSQVGADDRLPPTCVRAIRPQPVGNRLHHDRMGAERVSTPGPRPFDDGKRRQERAIRDVEVVHAGHEEGGRSRPTRGELTPHARSPGPGAGRLRWIIAQQIEDGLVGRGSRSGAHMISIEIDRAPGGRMVKSEYGRRAAYGMPGEDDVTQIGWISDAQGAEIVQHGPEVGGGGREAFRRSARRPDWIDAYDDVSLAGDPFDKQPIVASAEGRARLEKKDWKALRGWMSVGAGVPSRPDQRHAHLGTEPATEPRPVLIRNGEGSGFPRGFNRSPDPGFPVADPGGRQSDGPRAGGAPRLIGVDEGVRLPRGRLDDRRGAATQEHQGRRRETGAAREGKGFGHGRVVITALPVRSNVSRPNFCECVPGSPENAAAMISGHLDFTRWRTPLVYSHLSGSAASGQRAR